MKFKLDENLPVELVKDLRDAGHDAQSVAEEGLVGTADSAFLAHVRRERRVLMTMDKGIADVRVHPPEQYAGIVLFRPGTSGRKAVLAFVRRQLTAVLGPDIDGHLLVVTERNIRLR